MIATQRGYLIKGKKGLGHWESLIEEWLLCIERYCRMAAGEDAPFVYTERANIGVLAGAAWRCGRLALEEFQHQKGFKNRLKWNGRVDLYLASEHTEEMIEAKFGWLSISTPKRVQARVDSVLKLAERDARRTKGGHAGISCIAVGFLPAWIPAKNGDNLESKIMAAIACLPRTKCHAVAWCFPKEYRRVESSVGNYTPGVIMAISNPEYS